MKKIILIILIFLFSKSVSFADFGDILYVKNNNTNFRSDHFVNSKITKVLKKGYLVIDRGDYGSIWKKVELTNGSFGYIYGFNVINNNKSDLEIKGNIGEFNSNSLLRKLPYRNSQYKLFITKNTFFKILNINYINNDYVYVSLLNGTNKGKKGYIDKKFLKLYCINQNKINIQRSYLLFSNIRGGQINTYCEFDNYPIKTKKIILDNIKNEKKDNNLNLNKKEDVLAPYIKNVNVDRSSYRDVSNTKIFKKDYNLNQNKFGNKGLFNSIMSGGNDVSGFENALWYLVNKGGNITSDISDFESKLRDILNANNDSNSDFESKLRDILDNINDNNDDFFKKLKDILNTTN